MVLTARRSIRGVPPWTILNRRCVALWMQLLRRDIYPGMPLKNLWCLEWDWHFGR